MGNNSVVLILNDGLDNIQRNPTEWVEGIAEKILNNETSENGSNCGHGYCYGDVGASGFANCSSVITCNHADDTVVLAVGQNCATVLGHFYHSPHHTKEGQLELLEQLAKEHGYHLVKGKK